ncbi:hypothetical protein Tco_0866284 [Tanacetum coccineum]
MRRWLGILEKGDEILIPGFKVNVTQGFLENLIEHEGVKDKICGYFNVTSQGRERATEKMLCDIDQRKWKEGRKRYSTIMDFKIVIVSIEYEIRNYPGKRNVVTDALSRKGTSET